MNALFWIAGIVIYLLGVILCFIQFRVRLSENLTLHTTLAKTIAIIITFFPGINVICGIYLTIKDMREFSKAMKNINLKP